MRLQHPHPREMPLFLQIENSIFLSFLQGSCRPSSSLYPDPVFSLSSIHPHFPWCVCLESLIATDKVVDPWMESCMCRVVWLFSLKRKGKPSKKKTRRGYLAMWWENHFWSVPTFDRVDRSSIRRAVIGFKFYIIKFIKIKIFGLNLYLLIFKLKLIKNLNES